MPDDLPISLQQLINARPDAQVLDVVANGGSTDTIVNRVGQVVPSTAKVFADIRIQYGDAAANADRAEDAATTAAASANARESIAAALADTSIPVGGSFTAPLADGSMQAYRKNSTESETPIGAPFPTSSQVADVLKVASLGEPIRPNLVDFADGNDQVVVSLSPEADWLLPGLEGGVRAAIQDLNTRSKIGLAVRDDDLDARADALDQVYRRTAKDGRLYLAGMDTSVQEAIGGLADVDATLAATRTSYHTFSTETAAVIASRLQSFTGKYVPAPLWLLPGNFTIEADLTNAFTVAQPARTVIDTPYFADDGVVHPKPIEFYNRLRGYQYLCMINPYRGGNSTYENPVVYGVNDEFSHFEMMPGVPNPLATFEPPSNYNADNGFAYDPLTGDLIVYWIQFQAPASTIGWYRTTKDGINWEPRKQLFPSVPQVVESMVSPQLLYNPKTGYWHLYTQATTNSYPSTNIERKLRVRTSRHRDGPWSDPVEIPTGIAAPWHQDINYIGSKFYCLCANTFLGNFFLGESDDGITDWRFGTTPILTDNDPSYKGGFIPVFEDNKIALRLVWTSAGGHPTNPSLGWNLYTAQTNFVDIE